jgi:hypothetical protein
MPRSVEEPIHPYWDCPLSDLDRLRDESVDIVNRRFAQWRRTSYSERNYRSFASDFMSWHRRWTQIKNSEAKSANAQKGWEKRRKSGKDKVAPRPKLAALKEILEKP